MTPPTVNQFMSEWYTLAILFLFPLFLVVLRGLSKNPRHPPSPRKLPLIGNLHQLGGVRHRTLHDLSKKYGPLMLLHLGQVPTLVVSSADMAKQVMKTHDSVFASRPALKSVEILLYRGHDMAFAPLGEYWRQVKKICVTHFFNPKMVQSFRSVREEEVGHMIAEISRIASSSTSAVVNVSGALNSLLNDITCRIVLGKVFRSEGGNDFSREMIEESIEMLGGFRFADYFPKLGWVVDMIMGLNEGITKKSKRWDEVLDAVIQENGERLKDGVKNNNFVDIFLSLLKDPNSNCNLTKEHIKGLIIDIFLAGTDTSYITLEWSMAELVRKPEAMKKLQNEVRSIASGKSMVTEDDLSKMSYLKAVIKEIFRMHPATPMLLPRESIEKCQIEDYEVPKKSVVYINVWAIGRDPKVWEEPDEFRPERFINTTSVVDYRGNDYQLTPFGAGRRICPGLNFASFILELALANLVHRFDWELPNGMTVDDLDMADTQGLTAGRKQRLDLVAKPCSI